MFVVDSSDKLRMPVAQEELKTLLSHSSKFSITLCIVGIICLCFRDT